MVIWHDADMWDQFDDDKERKRTNIKQADTAKVNAAPEDMHASKLISCGTIRVD